MDKLKYLSGPVQVAVVAYSGRTYVLLSDKHNSTSGMCDSCDSLDGCMTVQDYIDRELSGESRVDFYIESPFVLKDTNVECSLLPQMDIIEQLQASMSRSMMREKSYSKYMPMGHVHYSDIRDVYIDDVLEEGIRKSYSSNPMSGSWSVLELNRHAASADMRSFIDSVDVVEKHVSFILDNVRDIVRSYVTPVYEPPMCDRNDSAASDFNNRVSRMGMLTSLVGGRRVHRVCKQLMKIDAETRESILEWLWERVDEQLVQSEEMFKDWKRKIQWFIGIGDRTIYNDIRHLPVSITVPYGSLVMDVYLLARSFRFNDSRTVIVYAGGAHVANYIDYFSRNGGRVVSDNHSTLSERCVVLI